MRDRGAQPARPKPRRVDLDPRASVEIDPAASGGPRRVRRASRASTSARCRPPAPEQNVFTPRSTWPPRRRGHRRRRRPRPGPGSPPHTPARSRRAAHRRQLALAHRRAAPGPRAARPRSGARRRSARPSRRRGPPAAPAPSSAAAGRALGARLRVPGQQPGRSSSAIGCSGNGGTRGAHARRRPPRSPSAPPAGCRSSAGSSASRLTPPLAHRRLRVLSAEVRAPPPARRCAGSRRPSRRSPLAQRTRPEPVVREHDRACHELADGFAPASRGAVAAPVVRVGAPGHQPQPVLGGDAAASTAPSRPTGCATASARTPSERRRSSAAPAVAAQPRLVALACAARARRSAARPRAPPQASARSGPDDARPASRSERTWRAPQRLRARRAPAASTPGPGRHRT